MNDSQDEEGGEEVGYHKENARIAAMSEIRLTTRSSNRIVTLYSISFLKNKTVKVYDVGQRHLPQARSWWVTHTCCHSFLYTYKLTKRLTMQAHKFLCLNLSDRTCVRAPQYLFSLSRRTRTRSKQTNIEYKARRVKSHRRTDGPLAFAYRHHGVSI